MCSCIPHEPDCTSHSLQFNSQPIWPRMSQILSQCWTGLNHATHTPTLHSGQERGSFSSLPHLKRFQPAPFPGRVVFQLLWTQVYWVRERNSLLFLPRVNTVHLGRRHYIEITWRVTSLYPPQKKLFCAVFLEMVQSCPNFMFYKRSLSKFRFYREINTSGGIKRVINII